MTDLMPSPEERAKEFHDVYERCAPEFGYETREDTKDFDPESPNGKLMIRVITEMDKKRDHMWLTQIMPTAFSATLNSRPTSFLRGLTKEIKKILSTGKGD